MSRMPPHSPGGPEPEGKPESSEPEIGASTAAELAALADGSLDAAQREHALERAAASPQLDAMLDEQRHAVALLSAAAEVKAPDALHARVQQLVDERPSRLRLPRLGRKTDAADADRVGASGARHGRRRPARLAFMGAAALVVVGALVVGLTIGSSGGASQSVAEYIALGTRPATAGPPAKSPGVPHLAVRVDGVAFPYWEDQFGWKASGVRSDRLAGRAVTTVFYRDHRGGRVAYSIVAGSPPPIAGLSSTTGTAVWRDGVRYWVQTVHGRPTVVWMRSGHRCILSGHGVSALELVALASWSGEGHLA